jgi:hypothetical protein
LVGRRGNTAVANSGLRRGEVRHEPSRGVGERGNQGGFPVHSAQVKLRGRGNGKGSARTVERWATVVAALRVGECVGRERVLGTCSQMLRVKNKAT